MEVDKRTRGHTLNIFKSGARLDCRRYSFSERVVNNWNALPAEAVSCTAVNYKGKIASIIQQGARIRCSTCCGLVVALFHSG